MGVQNVPSVEAVKSYIRDVTVREWISTDTYSIDELVFDAGNVYKSLANANTGNQPSTDTANTWWELEGRAYSDEIALALSIALG